LALEETPGVSTKVTEFVDLHPSFKAEDAFDMRVREAVALEVPKTEKFIIKTKVLVSISNKTLRL
jgi:hypothetical protein